MNMELIPDLPDDVGLECLIRVPYNHFSSVASVCRNWIRQINEPEFRRRRKAAGLTQKVIIMAQARIDSNLKLKVNKYSGAPVYRLTLFEPEKGYWAELPMVPEFSDGLPMFCQVMEVGFNLVVIGGWNSVTWEILNTVFIYNFASATWRRGADMPGCRRSFFACASDSDQMVFVAGGHDTKKRALKSAMVYDLLTNTWVLLPDMTRECDESKGVIHCGKFHVIGGYHTNMQGRFERSAEEFDITTWQWGRVREDFLDTAMCPRNCVDGGNELLYMPRAATVVARQGSTWQDVAELPTDVRSTSYMTAWHGKLLVIGSGGFGALHKGYLLDLKSYKWEKVDIPENFSGHVRSGCCLEL